MNTTNEQRRGGRTWPTGHVQRAVVASVNEHAASRAGTCGRRVASSRAATIVAGMLGACSTFRMDSGTGVWTACASSTSSAPVLYVSNVARVGRSVRPFVAASWSWSDSHWPAVREVVLEHAAAFVAFGVADVVNDMTRGRDAVLSVVDDGSFAVRIRRAWWTDGRGVVHRDLTLRDRVAGPSEWRKVSDGDCAAWYMVAASDNRQRADGTRGVADWFVVDMSAFRRSGLVGRPDDHRDNGDGTSFVAWSVETLRRDGCVVLDALDVTTTANTWPA